MSALLPTGLISLPLLKYSYATDAANATKFSWKHELNEVLVVFDNYGADRCGRQPSSVLKVLQGAKLLDHLDLIEKVRECNAAIKHALEVHIQLKADQLPTSALYRRMSSTIALRYTLPDSKIRRMQLKFTSVQHFDTALAIIEGTGCHLHNSAPAGEVDSIAPAQRPATASSALVRMNEQHVTDNGTQRPSSASSRPFHTPRNASDEQHENGSHSFHSHSRDGFEEPRRPYTSSSEHFPTSQHVYRSYTSSFAPTSQNVHSFRPATPLTPIHENEPSIYSDPVMQNIGAIDVNSRRLDPLRPRSAMPLSDIKSYVQSDPLRLNDDSRLALTGSSRFFSSAGQSQARPSTAPFPGSSVTENDITFMIPPRRELPFKRPGSRDDSNSSRPSTAADMKPLPTPTFAESSSSNIADVLDNTPRPSKTLADGILNSALEDRLAPMAVSKRRASVTKESPRKAPALTTCQNGKPSSRPESSKAANALAMETSSSVFRSSSPPRPRTALNEDSSSGHGSAALQSAARNNPTPPTSSHFQYSDHDTSHYSQPVAPSDGRIPQQQHPTRTNPNALPLNESLEKSLARINNSFSNAPDIVEANKENLAGYANMNHADRMAVVEKMIVTSVSDENFATLAEDVYGCWQRIGFEKR